jgi:error-prone DNA polymerase
MQALELGYDALAVTDHDGLYGAMEYAQTARAWGLRPITGAELTLRGFDCEVHHLTLLAENARGYANLCRLISYAHMSNEKDEPCLDLRAYLREAAEGLNRHDAEPLSSKERGWGEVQRQDARTPSFPKEGTEKPLSPRERGWGEGLPDFAYLFEGLIALSGCAQGEVPALLSAGMFSEAREAAERYAALFGKGNFYLELQHNLVRGDASRVRTLVSLAKDLGLRYVATNNVHYHERARSQLQDVMVAIRHRLTLDASHRERRPNSEFYLKPPEEMAALFAEWPEALAESVRIAGRCTFDLTKDLEYQFPDSPVPEGFTADGYLEHICREEAARKYLIFGSGQRHDAPGAFVGAHGSAPAPAAPGTLYPEPKPISTGRTCPEPSRRGVGVREAPSPSDQAFDAPPSDPHPTSSQTAPLGESESRRNGNRGGYSGRAATENLGGGRTAVRPDSTTKPLSSGAREEDPSTPVLQYSSTGRTAVRPYSPLPARVEERLQQELALIRKHKLAGFFLIYRDLMRVAAEVANDLRGGRRRVEGKSAGRGRGSSVGSIVCYLIGLSHIDPIANDLFFGRFLNEEMASVPDIDIDFPRDVREKLIERVYREYGQEHVALVCTFPTYRLRSAIRDVGKALGLPLVELDKLAKMSESYGSARHLSEEMARLPEFRAKVNAPLWRDLIRLAYELSGFPRHVSQHVGGMVISSRPIVEHVPVEKARMAGRAVCQWDKDSVDDARFIKIDFLALGMLSLVDECLDLIEEQQGKAVDLGRVPHDDQRVYDAICRGDTIGVFQIESRAQIQTIVRTQPRSIEDLTVEVAIVRPGPIVGGAVNPYIQHRKALREQGPAYVPEYDHPLLEPALKETLGVVIYQEQVLQVAMALAGFSAGQAESLRRAMSRKRSREAMAQLEAAFMEGAAERGCDRATAEKVFGKLMGFAEFGFPKSHAAAFGLLAYESAWLREYYPAEFLAALFNNQPMGFYSREVLMGDGERRGIEVLPPDINRSRARCSVEGDTPGKMRLGFARVQGISEEAGIWLETVRGETPFRALTEFVRRVNEELSAVSYQRSAGPGAAHGSAPAASVLQSTLLPASDAFPDVPDYYGPGIVQPGPHPFRRELVENLIAVGAFDEFGLSRRELLWQLGLFMPEKAPTKLLSPQSSVLSPGLQMRMELPVAQDMVDLPEMTDWERMATDYSLMSLSTENHPLGLVRPLLHEGIVSCRQMEDLPDGTEITLAGMVVCRQRPASASGFIFLLVEDETGLANIVVKPQLHERQRLMVRLEPFVTITGELQKRDNTVNLIARNFERLRVPRELLTPRSHDWG